MGLPEEVYWQWLRIYYSIPSERIDAIPAVVTHPKATAENFPTILLAVYRYRRFNQAMLELCPTLFSEISPDELTVLLDRLISQDSISLISLCSAMLHSALIPVKIITGSIKKEETASAIQKGFFLTNRPTVEDSDFYISDLDTGECLKCIHI